MTDGLFSKKIARDRNPPPRAARLLSKQALKEVQSRPVSRSRPFAPQDQMASIPDASHI